MIKNLTSSIEAYAMRDMLPPMVEKLFAYRVTHCVRKEIDFFAHL